VLLVPNSRLVLCQIFSYDFPKIRNLPKIFLRSFENVGLDLQEKTLVVALLNSNALLLCNTVALHQAQLVLRWLTFCRWVNHLGM